MALLDKDLVRAINSGKCFALIGTGPSCELGLPSWEQLAKKAIQAVESSQGNEELIKECEKLLSQKQYAHILGKVQKVIGRDNLISIVNSSLQIEKKTGQLYQYITSWPFPVYLTTNFDDCLIEHLNATDPPFSLRRNSENDMRVLRSDTKNLVFKIHGDTRAPEDMVLTDGDYLNFQKGSEREYWREKIFSVLNMIDVVFIGYSVSDPDFQEQLDRAKRIASPLHPVFMFAADMDHARVVEYYQRYNIRVIPYKNKTGTHRELHNLLRRYDPFVVKRGSPFLDLEPIDESVATLASSMYLFTQLRLFDTTDACIQKTYASVILQILYQLPTRHNVRMSTLLKLLKERIFATSNIDPGALDKALNFLYLQGFITLSAEDRAVTLEPKGLEALATIKAERVLLRQRFEASCRVFFKREYPALNEKSVSLVIDVLHQGLIRAYQTRGMEIAASVFSNKVIDFSDATDILEIINREASILKDDAERLAFSDIMLELFIRPDEDMKEYLSALSQGYFAYHALGLEPRCSQERLSIAKNRKWILDSSVLLPVLALNCSNHLYAKDLLNRIKDMGLLCYTTGRLFDEVRDHAWWAIRSFLDKSPQSPQFLQAAIAGPGYRVNLFLDGYMSWSLTQGAPSFEQYMAECLGSDFKSDLGRSLKERLETWGVAIVDFNDWPGFSQELYAQRDEAALKIERLRTQFGTFRGEGQCTAEAEVLIISQIDHISFLSQTNILNKLRGQTADLTWRPEAMYRFLSMFSSTPPGSKLLYDSMMQDFYHGGFDIVDRGIISKFVTPMVHQARMQLDSERVRYEEALGPGKLAQFNDQFERVPDEQKPFYSMQFAFYIAEQEIAKRKVAEAVAKKAVEVKALDLKERREFTRLKAKKVSKQKDAKRRLRKSRSMPPKKKHSKM